MHEIVLINVNSVVFAKFYLLTVTKLSFERKKTWLEISRAFAFPQRFMTNECEYNFRFPNWIIVMVAVGNSN